MSTESEEWQQLLRDFLTESTEILETFSFDILSLESSPQDQEILHKLFRNIHTIKGSAGFLGFRHLAEFGHKLEDLLNRLRHQQLKADSSVIDLLLIASDHLKDMVGLIRDRQTDSVDVEALSRKMDWILSSSGPVLKAPQAEPEKSVSFSGVSDGIPPPRKEENKESVKLGEILVRQNALKPEELEEALQ